MTKSKIDLSAAPNAAFQIKTESGPSEPIKPPATEKKKSDKPSLADAYTEKPRLNPEMIGKSLLDRMPNPTGWRLLILPYQGKGKTAGGIFLPSDTVEKNQVSTQVGYVLKVGPLAYKDPEKFPSGAWCAEKQWVMFARYAGSRFQIDGGEVRILNDDEILSTILDPEDIHQLT